MKGVIIKIIFTLNLVDLVVARRITKLIQFLTLRITRLDE